MKPVDSTQMPVKDINTRLRHSKDLAMKRLDQLLERLSSKDKQMENLYREFMSNTYRLTYMEKVKRFASLQVHLAKNPLHTDSTIAIAHSSAPTGKHSSAIEFQDTNLTENHMNGSTYLRSLKTPADIISSVNPKELSSLTLCGVNEYVTSDMPRTLIEPSITSVSDITYLSEL
ncbi:hypothetical protein TNIN_248841 [Trichonephila inaurata madagascariensis]|uniref:Uncharacterized protein n=1 Tax=Trichonephila inaurata madagascariensis TaxID=2747483 RepID=A0A8X6XSM9_9ARAC|nr:hypothetical protein TNIN_248841 [Trichonephila inaurata madagascariensis]